MMSMNIQEMRTDDLIRLYGIQMAKYEANNVMCKLEVAQDARKDAEESYREIMNRLRYYPELLIWKENDHAKDER
jgi:hypothetical protein